MATLAADKPRTYVLTGAHPDYNEVPSIASDITYLGAAVGESASLGHFRPLAAGDTFAGFCQEQCDNSAGAATAKLIKVLASGEVWLTVTNVDNVDDVGDAVYASDDDTFTNATTGNSPIGKVIRYDSTRTHKALVYFEAAMRRSI
jgi:hypothetical protein